LPPLALSSGSAATPNSQRLPADNRPAEDYPPIHQSCRPETYHQTDGIQARERQCSIIKFCRNHAPGMRNTHPGDHVGNVLIQRACCWNCCGARAAPSSQSGR
jgi:hypothetical protein